MQAERPDGAVLPRVVRSPFSTAGMIYRLATRMWHAGVTPGVVVRALGPFSRFFTRSYAEKRMHENLGLAWEEIDTFEPYIFQLLGSKGSGEVCMRPLGARCHRGLF